MSNPFISYAQNAEDVVLWRALGDVKDGRYVDVGAADPLDYSVTAAFYERGWRGVNIEPVPAFAAALRRHRPEDVIVQKAAGATGGTLELYVAEGTGLSTASADVAARGGQHGHHFVQVEVPVATLDEILEDAGLVGADIHFLKVDVEGFEADVLAGADLGRWKPWIVVVEATEPLGTGQTHQEWEPLVLAAGYRFCLFDGLNRFYASPDHPELFERLSYPVCVFDQPYQRADVSLAIERSRGEWAGTIDQLRIERQSLIDRLAEYDQMLRESIEREQLAGGREHAAGVRANEAAVEAFAQITTLQQRVHYTAGQVGDLRRENLMMRGHIAELGRVTHAIDQQRIVAEAERDGYHQRLLDANAHLQALQTTVSWRLTGPIRHVRRSLVPRRPKLRQSRPVPVTAIADLVEVVLPEPPKAAWERAIEERTRAEVAAFALRVAQATELVLGSALPKMGADDIPRLEEFESAVAFSDDAPGRLAWLALAMADGRYPSEADLRRAVRRFRLGGTPALIGEVIRRFDAALVEHRAPTVGLDIRHEQTLVDIAHTAANDLHTGIQRVVRHVCSRWFLKDEVVPVHWNHDDLAVRSLAASERRRMIDWADHLHEAGSEFGMRTAIEESGGCVVPWNCRLVVPELAAEPPRCDAYRALATSGVLCGFSFLVYDLIPITAAETVAEGMPGVFANYLSTLKYADRVSAISAASATDYRAFTAALASQGLTGPSVAAHLLPADDPKDVRAEVGLLDAEIGLDGAPLVLVVGSHEPRKNHLVILEAAEALWQQDHWFHLVFMGGSGWRSEEFDSEVERLIAAGLPVRVMKRVSEDRLWAGYAAARFTVFTSIVEGFGLPIAESLRCGTPVITSNYGSMAEVAVGGGAVLVDPLDPSAIRAAMSRLLRDDQEVNELRKQATERRWKSWDEYSAEVWTHLVPSTPEEK